MRSSSIPPTTGPAVPSGPPASSALRRPSRPRSSTCSPTRARAATRVRSSARRGSFARCRRTAPTSCASGSCRRCSRPTTTVRSAARSSSPSGTAGSDVGANRVEAVPDGDALAAARREVVLLGRRRRPVRSSPPGREGAPEGTRGIGCFLVPRVDGGGFRIRRLKDKLGTRALATGEIEFDGALAYPLGPLEDGFRTAVGVLNTSRWLNAVGSAGADAPRVPRGVGVRARARGVRPRRSSDFPSSARTWR